MIRNINNNLNDINGGQVVRSVKHFPDPRIFIENIRPEDATQDLYVDVYLVYDDQQWAAARATGDYSKLKPICETFNAVEAYATERAQRNRNNSVHAINLQPNVPINRYPHLPIRNV